MRDLEKDLEICQCLFAEPWEIKYREVSKNQPFSRKFPCGVKMGDVIIFRADTVFNYDSGDFEPCLDCYDENLEMLVEVSKAFPYWLKFIKERLNKRNDNNVEN